MNSLNKYFFNCLEFFNKTNVFNYKYNALFSRSYMYKLQRFLSN